MHTTNSPSYHNYVSRLIPHHQPLTHCITITWVQIFSLTSDELVSTPPIINHPWHTSALTHSLTHRRTYYFFQFFFFIITNKLVLNTCDYNFANYFSRDQTAYTSRAGKMCPKLIAHISTSSSAERHSSSFLCNIGQVAMSNGLKKVSIYEYKFN